MIRSALVFVVLASAFAAHAKDAPVQLAPYRVEERPFGFLGVKRATIVMNPWRLFVGMNAVRFVQIEELFPESPGIAAGVRPGDRVTSIDGVAISKFGLRKLRRMGTEVEVGQKMKVEIFRPSDASRHVFDIVIPKKPPEPISEFQPLRPDARLGNTVGFREYREEPKRSDT